MEIRQYISPLIKWWWLILGSTLVATLASVYAVSRQPDLYQARSAMMLGQAMNNPNPTYNELNMTRELSQTYIQMADRNPVRAETMDALDLTWLPQYAVRLVPDTQLIEILVNDTSPERAMVVANELANQIVLSSPTSAREQEDLDRQAFINNQLDDLEAQIEVTNGEILDTENVLANSISARQIADLEAQLTSLENKLRTLQSNYADLIDSTQQGAINSLTVFEEATVPLEPIGPNRMSTVLTAAAIGFVLGVLAAYFLEYLDDTVKSPAEVERLTHLPTLTGIAAFPEENSKQPLIALDRPRSPISEAYRGLRTAIMFTHIDKAMSSILVSSPNIGEGKSVTAANLGIVMAQAGHRVLLVEADLRRPKIQEIFDRINSTVGLTNLLLEMIIEREKYAAAEDIIGLVERTIHDTQQNGLFLLTCGPKPPNPAELVGSEKMGMLMKVLSDAFDIVIVDAPPILAVTDAVVLSTRVDGVVLVSSAGETRRDQLKQATEQLREVNAQILGVVLNRLSPKTAGYYYSGTHYYDDLEPIDDLSGDDGHSRNPRNKNEQSQRRRLPHFFSAPK